MKQDKQIPILNTEQSVVERFDLIARTFPDKAALRDSKSELSYRMLQEKSNVIANHLLKLGTRQKQIALFLNFGIDQFAAIFGILKAGFAYIPIDTSWPAHRIEFSIKDSCAAAVITDHANLGQVKALSGDRMILNIEELDFTQNTSAPENFPGPDDVMHILYTSGSTGEPKGVYTNHRNQLHFVKRFSDFIDIRPDDIFAYYFSIGFSAHAMPSLGALLNGGTLVMYDLKKNGFQGLAEFFNKEMITACLMIPSVLRHFRATLHKDFKINKLRTLLIGGETLYFNDIKQIWPFLKRKTEVINIYASTEMFLSFAFRMKRDTVLKQNIIPIGYPVEGIELEIRNEDGMVCEPNQVGEMIIFSPYSALGYWQKPELTAADFRQTEKGRQFNSRDLAYIRTDGAIVHVGRKDAMVKIRGQRVDLGEIENTLLFSKEIQEVAVMMKEDPLGNKVLSAYYVCGPGRKVDVTDISHALVRRLPDFMIPKFLQQLDSLPKTDSGKTDYQSLPDPNWGKTSGKEDIKHASNPVEEQLISIFEKNFDVYPIGVSDNILQAGHDSLKMFVAFDTVEKSFGIKLDLDSFLENPTIEALALIIKKLQEHKNDQ